MNIQTLKKLAKNPHYKLTEEQKRQLAEAESKEVNGVRVFGKPPIHPTLGKRKA